MREWIEELSDYMQAQEKAAPTLTEVTEEMHQAALETDVLLEASDQMQSAYSSIIGKMNHVNTRR